MTLSSPVFRAVATCVVPEASRLDAAQWDEMAAIVGRAMAARPRAIQRQLALFLILLEWFPLFRHGRRLSRLDPARRTKFLDQLQRAPMLLLRRGFWGVRTDRKSTRLNSSHSQISYAVFCLKKKTTNECNDAARSV